MRHKKQRQQRAAAHGLGDKGGVGWLENASKTRPQALRKIGLNIQAMAPSKGHQKEQEQCGHDAMVKSHVSKVHIVGCGARRT